MKKDGYYLSLRDGTEFASHNLATAQTLSKEWGNCKIKECRNGEFVTEMMDVE